MGPVLHNAPEVPSALLGGASEVVNIDAVIDRMIIKYQRGAGESLDRSKMIDVIHTQLSPIFNKNIGKMDICARVRKVIEYKNQLHSLLNLPKLEQRTPAWYEARNNMITASDYAQSLGFGKFGTQKQFYEKKCGYEQDKFDSTIPALKWGIMFEAVACSAYTKKNENVTVHEFGLLKHPSVSHLGASPDGISDMGVMIEIKCPWRRKITGEIPLQYYYQMQGQLDVCGLDECDYLECGFSLYDTQGEFEEDFDKNEHYKGIIIELQDVSYAYVDHSLWHDVRAQIAWMHDTIDKMKNEIVATNFWKLHTYSVRRVYRDEAFLNSTYPKLETVWQNVVSFKSEKSRYDFYMIGAAASTASARRNAMMRSREQVTIDTTLPRHHQSDNGINNKATGFEGYAFVDDDDADDRNTMTQASKASKISKISKASKASKASNVSLTKTANGFANYAFREDDG